MLRGAFSNDGIVEYIREMTGGRGRTTKLRGDALPAINTVEPWDGQDGQVNKKPTRCTLYRDSTLHLQLPVEDDYDLSDFDMDSDSKDEL